MNNNIKAIIVLTVIHIPTIQKYNHQFELRIDSMDEVQYKSFYSCINPN